MEKLIANRFEVNNLEKDLLGRGGMGEVYRAIDAQTGETVVVKALIGLAHTDKSGKVA
jgi:serine/threonine protein kinase